MFMRQLSRLAFVLVASQMATAAPDDNPSPLFLVLGDIRRTDLDEDSGDMKVPINAIACIDLDAPTLPAERIKVKGVVRWRVWCRHSEEWHDHGPAEGAPRGALPGFEQRYWRTGYNLAMREGHDL